MDNSKIIVDKIVNKSVSLASIMPLHLCNLMDVVEKCQNFNSVLKSDATPVTDLDYSICEYIKSVQADQFPEYSYFSEENHQEWKFPLMVVDPVDGTKELMKGSSEWSVSIALLEDEFFNGEGWIFQPKLNHVFDENSKCVLSTAFQGEVSHSEWEEGMFKNLPIDLTPVGSIALKLARLYRGDSAFVVSLRPKNIWDIAGGTLLLKRAGFVFYSAGKLVTKVQKKYDPPLIWCRPDSISKLLEIFSETDKDL